MTVESQSYTNCETDWEDWEAVAGVQEGVAQEQSSSVSMRNMWQVCERGGCRSGPYHL